MEVDRCMPSTDQGLVHTVVQTEPVLISVERLRELEAIEASIPKLIEQAILEHKKNYLRKLHEKDKSHPENVNLRVKRYAERHREELNQRRREKRRLKKLEVESKKENQNPEPKAVQEPVIVRFDDVPRPPRPEKVKSITVRVQRVADVIVGNTIVTM